MIDTKFPLLSTVYFLDYGQPVAGIVRGIWRNKQKDVTYSLSCVELGEKTKIRIGEYRLYGSKEDLVNNFKQRVDAAEQEMLNAI